MSIPHSETVERTSTTKKKTKQSYATFVTNSIIIEDNRWKVRLLRSSTLEHLLKLIAELCTIIHLGLKNSDFNECSFIS